MDNFKKISFIFLSFFVISGCGAIRVRVDSISATEELKIKSYYLIPGNKGVEPSDLIYKEYVAYVHRALKERGFILAKNKEDADLAIFLQYGVGEPKKSQLSISMPTWGQTGVSSSHTVGREYNGISFKSTTHTPQYGVTGYSNQTVTRYSYFSYVIITAFDIREYYKSNKLIEEWSTKLSTNMKTTDLRRTFPLMIAGGLKYIGSNTGQAINVQIFEEHPRVLKIKGIKYFQDDSDMSIWGSPAKNRKSFP